MLLTAQELGVINFTLHQAHLNQEERAISKDVLALILNSTEGEGDVKKFVDGEVDLKTMQKAFIIKALTSLTWTSAQWDVVDVLVEKMG